MSNNFIKSIIATAMFVIVLLVVYYIHVTMFQVNVVFYAAIADGVLAAVITGVLVLLMGYFRALTALEKAQLFMIFLLSGYAFAISVPAVIDRSLSLYILEKLQQRGGGILQASFEQVFTQEYVKEHRLVDVRLTEQLESGTIVIEGGCVKLTDKGRRVASFGRYFRQHWLPKKRLLMGEYSDDLTNPFRASSQGANYECQ